MNSTPNKPIGLGLGIYSIPDAARLVGTSQANVRRWISPSEGLVSRVFGEDKLLTFAELMELHFIKMFRQEGVSMHTIKIASEKAAERFHSACPFSVKRFDTDGTSIFATLESESNDKELLEDIAKGQLVFERILRPFFRKLEYGKNFDLVRYWPLSKSGRVVLDPTRKFGKPIDSETGIPINTILNALKAGGGQSRTEVAKWLGIPITAVNKAVAFEQSLSA
jgi:uncharacterized protein (DUF433 family)/DNA-binding transcriptional MerR regulator